MEKQPMTKLEREVLTDSLLKIESIQASLENIDDSRIPDAEDINDCLESADKSFRQALREGAPSKKRTSS
jgi:hypothetical protein